MKIREATKKDFKAITEIMRNEFGKAPYNEEWTDEYGLKTLNYYAKAGEIYVCLIDTKIVGSIIIRKEYYRTDYNFVIEEVMVSEDSQGKGVGTALINFIENLAKKQKIGTLILFSNKKAAAYKFYIKKGYKPDLDFTWMDKKV